jgi:class 3 adenylate cyclase
MAKEKGHLFQSLTHYRITLILLAGLLVSGHFGLFEVIDRKISKPIEFRLRNHLNLDPDINPRIKIINLDDRTVTALGRTDLTLSEWGLVLEHLSLHRPSRILIDKVFQVVEKSPINGPQEQSPRELAPVYVGTFSSPTKIPGRPTVQENAKILSGRARLPWAQNVSPYIYGPADDIKALFSGYGTINYRADGHMPAALQTDDGTLYPTLGLMAGNHFEVTNDGLLVDHHRIPVRADGDIQVNLSNVNRYFEKGRAFSMGWVLRSAQQGKNLRGFNEGDIVFILPMMYTGNADFKSTPLGDLEGGLLHVSVANSLLNRAWIHMWQVPLLAAALAALFTLALAHFTGPLIGLISSLATVLFLSCGGLMLFCFFAHSIPWAEASLVASAAGLSATAERARMQERDALQIRHALAGLVSPRLLQSLLKDLQRIKREARAARVTVMFIDIEGFSLKSQERDPNIVFRRLKEELSHLCHRVHLYGGVVDKTLGDGLMCYFGHNFSGVQHSTDREHALAALACAIDIQLDSARRAIDLAESTTIPAAEKMAFPLRIGINTGEVYAGNIGTDDRIDLTVIGTTVNWAKRFEDSCESFRIMMGPETKSVITKQEGIGDFQVTVGDRTYTLKRRDLIVKHYEHKWDGWECNPFEGHFSFLTNALGAVTQEFPFQTPRYQVSPNAAIKVIVDNKQEAQIIAFSDEGLTIASNVYLAKHDVVDISFKVSRDSIQDWQIELMNLSIHASVIWGVQHTNHNQHGLKYLEMSQKVREHVTTLLKRIEHEVSKNAEYVLKRTGSDI